MRTRTRTLSPARADVGGLFLPNLFRFAGGGGNSDGLQRHSDLSREMNTGIGTKPSQERSIKDDETHFDCSQRLVPRAFIPAAHLACRPSPAPRSPCASTRSTRGFAPILPFFPHWLIDPRRVTERDFSPLKIRHRSRTWTTRHAWATDRRPSRPHFHLRGGVPFPQRMRWVSKISEDIPRVSGRMKHLFTMTCFYSYIYVTSPRLPFPLHCE